MSDIENDSPAAETPEEKVIPRVFVNYIDTYTAKAISELLAKSYPGISRADGEEEGDEDDEVKRSRPASELFQLSGTLSNPDFVPAFPCTIVDNDESSIQSALMAADFIVYSIAEGGAVTEAQQALEFLKYEAAHFLSPKKGFHSRTL